MRETIESVVVAFILAFLFRAFVAEAFVIPTGSMAPTLMGAHKDVYCEFCGQQYQASASSEFDSNTGAQREDVAVASTCATCRGLNAYDFRNNRNHSSFSGDRILVSKFDYVLSRPKRWDVFVFKYPTEARMNYIKRLVGLPGESLLIEGGDVYTQTEDAAEWNIARKPPAKIRAMRQIVSDTDHQAAILIEQGWPSLWQPWNEQAETTAWTVQQSPEQWNAALAQAASPQWLRYYHKFADNAMWQRVLSGGKIEAVDPYASQLVTDYLAYNSSILWSRDRLYDGKSLKPKIEGRTRALDVAIQQGLRLDNGNVKENDGYHWVGDLVADFDIDIASNSGQLLLDLVEFGVHFQLTVDVADGSAQLQALGSDLPPAIFGDASSLTVQTPIRGPGKYRVEMANVDDQIVLWVNGSEVEFEQPAEFNSRAFRSDSARRPYWQPSDPLDAAPAGIGGQNIELSVTRARVYRDIYYIAIDTNIRSSEYSDYDLNRLGPMLAALPESSGLSHVHSVGDVISAIYAHPQWWAETNLFSQRRQLQFDLEEQQYFPMGDNSAASSDARSWGDHNYVEEKFLLGKALLVFWPHTW
ncbi:MAG: signal peptidase I, partial [Planctomycetales bacterium]|nr:signal peptidase I [Planctomycetales bacterium]